MQAGTHRSPRQSTIVTLVTVRLDSTRLPGKALIPIHGRASLGRLLDGVRRATIPGSVVVCTTARQVDDPLEAFTALRKLTTKLQPRVLSALCYLISPFIVLGFSIPAWVLSMFGPTRFLADRIPFNFGNSPFSVYGDLMDRFGTPIEFQYSRDGVIVLLQACGLTEIRPTRLRMSAGWVARGVARSHSGPLSRLSTHSRFRRAPDRLARGSEEDSRSAYPGGGPEPENPEFAPYG